MKKLAKIAFAFMFSVNVWAGEGFLVCSDNDLAFLKNINFLSVTQDGDTALALDRSSVKNDYKKGTIEAVFIQPIPKVLGSALGPELQKAGFMKVWKKIDVKKKKLIAIKTEWFGCKGNSIRKDEQHGEVLLEGNQNWYLKWEYITIYKNELLPKYNSGITGNH